MAKPKPSPPSASPLVEGTDYYLENGFWVFTEHFLRRRGHCCGSGCRHCPYRKEAKARDGEKNDVDNQ